MSFKRIDLYHIIDLYNWDYGFIIPSVILKHPDCDIEFAMVIFDCVNGTSFLIKKYVNKVKEIKPYLLEHWRVCSHLFDRIANGGFKIDDKTNKLSVGLKVVLLKMEFITY